MRPASRAPLGKVMIYCARRAPTLEHLELARRMAADGRLEPVITIPSAELENWLPDGSLEGLTVHRSYPSGRLQPPAPRWIPSRMRSLPNRTLRWLVRTYGPSEVREYLATHYQLQAGAATARSVFRQHDPIAVIVPDDRSLRGDIGVVYAAKAAGKPTIAVPFALSDPSADVQRRQQDPHHDVDRSADRWFKRRLARRHAEQVTVAEGRRLFFLRPGQMLALRQHGMLFSHPWTCGGGATDFVAVFGASDRDRFVRAGADPGKLVVTGQCSLDGLWERARHRASLRDGLAARNGWSAQQPLLVLAMPQYGEHGMIPRDRHLRGSADLLCALGSSGVALLVSLHPRSNPADYEAMVQAAGARISDRPLVEILAGADVFVATHSSTVRWAGLLGIPTVILDDFGIGQSIFEGIDGLAFVTDRRTLKQFVSRLAADEDERRRRVERLRASCSRLDPFDGKSSRRVIELILRECSRRPAASAAGAVAA